MTEDQLAAIEKMKSESPPYPTELLESLGVKMEHASKKELGKPYFTGWKGLIGGASPDYYHPLGYFPEVDLSDIGYCAQWIYWIKREPHNTGVFVNLPGMQCGFVYEGGVFDIGDQRVRWTTPPEEISAMIRVGYKMLMETVEKEIADPIRLRHGSCCPHTAEDHVWLARNGNIYSTACNQCECCVWKEKGDAE